MAISMICFISRKPDDIRDVYDNLSESLPTWLCDDVSEILITDWGSDPPLHDFLVENGLLFEQIQVIRIDEGVYYNRAVALNVAARRVVGNRVICKMDADYKILKPDFIEQVKYQLTPHTFIGGIDCRSDRTPYLSHEELTQDERNQLSLMGFMYVKTSDFFCVNGYNEGLVGYGVDDIDMYKRLATLGLEQLKLDVNQVWNHYIARLDHLRNFDGDKQESDEDKRKADEHLWNRYTDSMRPVKFRRISPSLVNCELLGVDKQETTDIMVI